LFGSNTNKGYKELSGSENRLYKMSDNDSTLHFTLEYVEKNSGLRFARTYFLSNLSQGYMRNMYFSQEEEHRRTAPQGKVHELNSKTLFSIYRALIQTYQECSSMFLKGELTVQELGSHGYQTFKKYVKTEKVPEKE
jgi:hypothetical protein